MSNHQSTIAPGAQPYLLSGGPQGILLIHGLGGSGDDFRLAASLLHQQGWTVSVMRVAGHGSTWQEAAATHLPDWRQSVDEALDELRQRCTTVLVLGSSFGGALAFDAIARRPVIAEGVVAVNTPLEYRMGGAFQSLGLHMLRLFTPVFPKPGLSAADRERYKQSGSLPAWPITLILESKKFLQTIVRPSLRAIHTPLLHIENSNDPYISGSSGQTIDRLFGGPITHVQLPTVTHRPFRDEAQTKKIVQAIIQFSAELQK